VGDTIDITYLLSLTRVLVDRLRVGPADTAGRGRGDRGAMTTETVVIVAGLAALALAVVAIIVAKVTAKANSIPTN